MRLPTALVAALTLVSIGCANRQNVCTEAKEVFDRMGRQTVEAAVKNLPDGRLAESRREAEVLLADSMSRFDATCTSTDDATLSCLKRLGAFEVAQNSHRAALEACSDAACVAKADAELTAALGECKAILEAFGKQLARE